jgi:hypothetical protein
VLTSLKPWLGVGLLTCALAAPNHGFAQEETQPVASAPSASTASSVEPTFIHLEADPSVSLRRRGGRFGTHICGAPCDVTVDVSYAQTFYLEGLSFDPGGVRLSPGRRNEIAVAGDQGVHVLGFSLLTVGGAAFGAGGLVFAFHGFISAVYDDELPTENIALYSSLVGGGALLLAVGIPLFVAGDPTLVVEVTEGSPVSLRPDGLAVQF